ncbi:MAG: hypothetical protein AMXMBFR58_28170 [Phycisphaerae bacterium]
MSTFRRSTWNRPSMLVLAGAGVSGLAALVVAGPLDPPVGPVSASFKTLQQVEPRIPLSDATTPGNASFVYRITEPGSYYLTANVEGTLTKGGIEIAASGVTIDLNGFEVIGAGAQAGIRAISSNYANAAVYNGTVRNWGGNGVDLNNISGSVVRDVVVADCGGYGIAVNGGGLLSGCVATGNGGTGMRVLNGSRAENCTARANTGQGFYVTGAATISGCVSTSNLWHGIEVGGDCVVTRNQVSNAGQGAAQAAGIYLTGNRNRCEENAVTTVSTAGGDQGIAISGSGNFVARNTVSGYSAASAFPMWGTHTVGPVVTATGTITTTNPWANFVH